MATVDWNKLRDRFFKECTDQRWTKEPLSKVVFTPHDLFEWFKKELASQLTPFRRTTKNSKG